MVFRFFLVVLLSLGLPAAFGAAPAGVYKSVLVMDADTGAILLEDQADLVSPPASITKLMSFLVVHDAIRAGRLTLRTPVTTAAADSKIGGTQVWLKEGEVFEVEELLMAMMIQSANDAAHALAVAAAGSREAFVAAMNDRARQLGMTRTTWRTPHGLPPTSRRVEEGDVTTPRDLAILSRALVRETDILRYTSIPLAKFGEGKRPQPVVMDNHNNLVGKVRGVDGLKTGYTRAAGFCLAATAERDGRRLIAVIMGSPTSQQRDVKMAELIEAGFAKLPPAPARAAASPVTPAPATRPVAAPAAAAASVPASVGPHKAAIEDPVSPSAEAPVLTRVPLSPAEATAAPKPADPQADETPTVQFKLPK